MSVYIPNMEIPRKRCEAIIFVHKDGSAYIALSPEEGEVGYFREYPLVPVPEHGRLGDLDAAVEKLKRLREYHSDDSQSGTWIAHGISQCIDVLSGRETPIIPTDKEKTYGRAV